MLNLKKLNLALLLVTVLVVTPTIQIVLGQTSPFWISSGVYPHGVTYTIWRGGSYYYCKNAYGQQSAWSGSTNASYVINSAITALPDSGGKVYVTAGEYILTASIEIIRDFVQLYGEGMGFGESGFASVEDTGLTKFKVNTDIDAIRVVGPYDGNALGGIDLRDFYVYGSGKDNGKSGIYAYQTDQMFIERVSVQEYGTGIYIRTCDSPVVAFSSVCWNGVGLVLHTSYHARITNTEAWDIDHEGIWVTSGADHNRFLGNGIGRCATGIVINDTAVNNTFVGNQIEANTVQVSVSTSGNIFAHNVGFITENSGTAEASNTDAIIFSPNFAGTPQTVIITVNENDARYIAQAYSISASQFLLYLWDDTAGALETTDKTISWYAEYSP